MGYLSSANGAAGTTQPTRSAALPAELTLSTQNSRAGGWPLTGRREEMDVLAEMDVSSQGKPDVSGSLTAEPDALPEIGKRHLQAHRLKPSPASRRP